MEMQQGQAAVLYSEDQPVAMTYSQLKEMSTLDGGLLRIVTAECVPCVATFRPARIQEGVQNHHNFSARVCKNFRLNRSLHLLQVGVAGVTIRPDEPGSDKSELAIL